MAKANKKSLDAKAYINGKVNKFREERRKTSGEEARRQLAENFKETTSTDEYQENLKVVREDSDAVRKYAKRKKGGDVTPEEFRDVKTEFYGKDMNLELGEDFEKLDLGKRVDYIFERFGDTDYAADLIISLLDPIKNKYSKRERTNIDQRIFKNGYMNLIFNQKSKDNDSLDYWWPDIRRKFGNGPVTLRLGLFLMENFNGENRDTGVQKRICDNWSYENLTQNTLKHFAKGSFGAKDLLVRSHIISGCKDGSITDHDLLNVWINTRNKINFKKVSVEGQKYIIDGFIKNRYYDFFKWEEESNQNVIDEDINLGDNIDVVDYIFKGILEQEIKQNRLDVFCINMRYDRKYHKNIANILVQEGEIDVLKRYIDKFYGLTEIEKAEILGDTELENKLNRENFDRDLVKLQELGDKLGIVIEVKDKNDKKEENDQQDKEQEEIEEGNGGGWRGWFGKKRKK